MPTSPNHFESLVIKNGLPAKKNLIFLRIGTAFATLFGMVYSPSLDFKILSRDFVSERITW